MSVPANTLVTVVQMAGHWVGMQVMPDNVKKPVTRALKTQEIARVAAQQFAREHHIAYQDDALFFNTPVVTIWKARGCWVPAKIYPQHIEGAGYTTEDKNAAIEKARQLAEREKLDFAPSIGETAFRE